MTDNANTWLGKVGLGRMSPDEHTANIAGLNTFFCAILRFAGRDRGLDPVYLQQPPPAGLCVLHPVLASLCPKLIGLILRGDGWLPNKVRRTLVVWTLMTHRGRTLAPRTGSRKSRVSLAR